MGMEQIRHFVLLMMENRSFDHYLGALTLAPEARGDIEGLVGGLPVNRHIGDPPTDTGVPPWPLDNVKLQFFDPPHESPEVRQQWDEGKMDGFVQAYERFHARSTYPTPLYASPLLGTAPPAPPSGRWPGWSWAITPDRRSPCCTPWPTSLPCSTTGTARSSARPIPTASSPWRATRGT
jgi:hypothetical protein